MKKIRWKIVNLLLPEEDRVMMKKFSYDYRVHLQHHLACGRDFDTQESMKEDISSLESIFDNIKVTDWGECEFAY